MPRNLIVLQLFPDFSRLFLVKSFPTMTKPTFIRRRGQVVGASWAGLSSQFVGVRSKAGLADRKFPVAVQSRKGGFARGTNVVVVLFSIGNVWRPGGTRACPFLLCRRNRWQQQFRGPHTSGSRR